MPSTRNICNRPLSPSYSGATERLSNVWFFVAALVLLLLLSPVAKAQGVANTVAFVSNRSGRNQVWTQGLDSSGTPVGNPFQVTTGGGGQQESNSPNWSTHANRTDGSSKIAYQFGAPGVRGVHLINPDGTADLRVDLASGDKINPSWSPDGQFIVYSKEPSGSSDYDLWIHKVSDADDTNDFDLLLRPNNSDLAPAWSPDGNTIAFTTQTGAHAAIAVQGVQEVNGTVQIVQGTFQVLTDNLFADFHASWSPESQFITFSSTRSGGHDVYRMSATQGENDKADFIQLTTSSANDTNPAWSPDGRTIAFASDRSGNTEIYLMAADKGEAGGLTNITTDPASDDDPYWMPSWQPLQNQLCSNGQPCFNASTALLLTDGTVMVHDSGAADWWKLTPIDGSYVKGTWSQLASLPSGYAPLYYASAVLADGRVVVEGGEYNFGVLADTTLGAVYNPTNNSWVSINPPSGWSKIGDGQSAVLSNGTFMLADCCDTPQPLQALLSASKLTWKSTGAGKADSNDEEGWTLLPDGSLLTIDANNGTNSERYIVTKGSWVTAGSTIVELADLINHEVGPAVLRPDGTVFATGATGNNAVYSTTSHTWSMVQSFPKNAAGKQLAIPDGPAALLPGGSVLCDTSPVIEAFGGFESATLPPPPNSARSRDPASYPAGSQFFEFDGRTLLPVSAPPRAPVDPAYVGRMLVLPTGQVLFTDGSMDVEVYTSNGSANSAWAPSIVSAPTTVMHGVKNYAVKGTQFNGLSQGAAYGDDAQSATNYPLVRITNNATGHVLYVKTHNHSTMGVATGSKIVSTKFDVPANIETGNSTLVVVANGIASNPISITVN